MVGCSAMQSKAAHNDELDDCPAADVHQPPPPPRPPKAAFLRDFENPKLTRGSLHADVSRWIDSITGLGRGGRCQSDNHIYDPSDDFLTSRARSAPEMYHIRDADGFLVPRVPASSESRSRRAGAESVTSWGVSSGITDSTRSSPKTLVETRRRHLLHAKTSRISCSRTLSIT